MKTNCIHIRTIVYIVTLVVILFFPLKVFSQNFSFIGDRSFGTIGGEQEPLILNYNNNIIIAGHTSYTGIDGDKTEMSCATLPSDFDVWMLMVDYNFNIIWDKTIGGLSRDEIHGLVIDKNKAIVFSGETQSDSSCNISTLTRGNSDLWFCMIDSSGNKIIDKRYGSNGADFAGKSTRCSNNDFLIFGGSSGGISGDKSTPGFGGSDLWLVRTDSLGNKLWDNTYGGSSNEPVNFISDYFIYETNSSEIILGGRTASSISGTVTSIGYGQGDAWIQKSDSNGAPIWDKIFGGTSDDRFGKILHTTNGYLLLGTSNSKVGGTILDSGLFDYDVWIVKIDTLGNQFWEKRYGGIGIDFGIDIQEAPDGGFWVLGETNGPAGYDISEPSYGNRDYWIFKIDSAGNKIWDKRFGGPGIDKPSSFIIMPDSSIFICGHAAAGISAVKADSGKGGDDYWIVHFNYYNNTTGINSTNAAQGITVSPNPTQSIINLKGLPMGQYEAVLFGVDGRVIKQSLLQGGNDVSYSLDDVSPGMYLLRFNGEKFTATIKVMKE
ncbi:MAG: T9SS type A sorting domain-containing protein [Bacteroidetes bacterium]|nr:T9SS type A sorting domain-containing protein [Bacteroidota bacterium]